MFHLKAQMPGHRLAQQQHIQQPIQAVEQDHRGQHDDSHHTQIVPARPAQTAHRPEGDRAQLLIVGDIGQYSGGRTGECGNGDPGHQQHEGLRFRLTEAGNAVNHQRGQQTADKGRGWQGVHA